jgi:transposase
MARYRELQQDQTRLLPVSLNDQIQPGTFEYTLNYLIDHEVNCSLFDTRYHNDATGASAIDPAVLLKIILFAYSRGILSSRHIARCCQENVLFMALACDTRPHFTTIASFISSSSEQIVSVFRDVLAVCYAEGLIGASMFAVDGCKISSNCSKEWSGTRKELAKKAAKIEESVRFLLSRHHAADESGSEPEQREKEARAVENLQRKADKIRSWLEANPEKIGTQGKAVKSNIVDNESAKMPSSHGVIQGYNGVAVVDDKHQIVVEAQVFGDGHEARHLPEVLDSLQKTFRVVDAGSDVLQKVVLTADSGFHSEQSVKDLLERGVDAYVADTKFRLRDPRFASLQEHRKSSTDSAHTSRARKYFGPDDFPLDEASGEVRCPAGHVMKCTCRNFQTGPNGFRGRFYKADAAHCAACELRARCIRNPATKARQMAKLEKGIRGGGESFTQKMIERFDSVRGRSIYSRRMGTVEPVFANIRSTLGLDRFTLRGTRKVGTQWRLFCIVHNIGKLVRRRGETEGT